MKTIYYHGTIITMDENKPEATAIYIQDGKIVAVGADEEILAYQDGNTILIDLGGKTMLPGFIDGHSHFSGVANSLSQCDLANVTNFQEIVTTLKSFIENRSLPKEAWVVGCNYDHNFLTEKKHPDRYLLDQVSRTHPVVIVHASSHMGVANSAALKAQHIDENTPDPAGGHYGRNQNQQPNGYMEENAFIQFQNNMPMISFEELQKNLQEAQHIYASHGITTVQEGMVAAPLWQLLTHTPLYLDVVAYIDIINHLDLLTDNQKYLNRYHQHLKIGGYKIFLDGSPQGRTAWMKEPYKDGDGKYCGYPILTNDALATHVNAALDRHQQLLAHCNGDAAAQQYIDVFTSELEKRQDQTSYRPVMVHAQFVQPQQLKQMKKIGMMPSFFTSHTYYWGDIHIANVGYEKASQISPAKSACAIGLPFTFHQDSPVVPCDMIKTIWCACNRITKNGVRLGENQCISVIEALKAITINGAYQYFEEDTKGSLTPNKVADCVILDQNPLTTDIKALDQIQVLTTIKGGKVIYQK